jgi:hypothetical protein
MGEPISMPSRRSMLSALALLPAASVGASPWSEALTSLHQRYGDAPAWLGRTKEGRSLSRFRYQQAERYLLTLQTGFFAEPRFVREALHMAGFISQQALCAYLLDIGFTDAWTARHIKQDIVKALTYANACGLGHACPDMARLAVTLSPFWKWGYHYDAWEKQPDRGGYTPERIVILARALVEHVHEVTGHPRPRGWHRQQGDRS